MVLTTSLRSGYFNKPNFILSLASPAPPTPSLLLRRLVLSHSEEFFQCILVLRELLFVSFQLKDTIVKLEYISFLFFNCESYHSSIFHKEQSSIHLFFVKKFRVCGKKTSTVSFLKTRNYNIATDTESDFFCITFVDLGRAKINCALKRKEKLPQKK